MPQKYIVYFNQKSIVFNNPTPEFVRNLSVRILPGTGEACIENALKLLENEKDEQASLLLQDLSFEDGIALLKNRYKLIRAAGGLIRNPDEHYLLIHRLGQWDLPKGKIESGESDEEACIREIEEETGIQIDKTITYLCSTWHTYKLNDTAYLKETVWFSGNTKQNSNPVAQIEEAIESAEWCSAQDADNKLTRTYPSISDVWETWKKLKSINL